MKGLSFYIVYISLFFVLVSCKSQELKTKERIIAFNKELLFNKEITVTSLVKYLELHEMVEKSKHLNKIVAYHKTLDGDEMIRLNGSQEFLIKVLSHKEVGLHADYRTDYAYSNLQYEGKKDNVYYYIYSNIEDKIVAPIIVNDKGKIISFYCYFGKGDDPVIPFMLNELPKMDIFGKPFE